MTTRGKATSLKAKLRVLQREKTMKTFLFMLSFIVVSTLAACTTGTTNPEPVTTVFKATLSSDQEVPPVVVATTATGTAEAKLVGTTLTISGTFKDLTGAPSMAHLHGPGATGATGPIIYMLTIPNAPVGELTGTVTLTEAQITDLKAGNLYFNIHTTANAKGEIRGQIK
jgi:CHRD domain